MFDFAAKARGRGIEVIIAGAGGAAHLPGMVAAKTVLPVIGVPVDATSLNGLDSLLSIVQMPRGVPVATVAIGRSGAVNAGLLAAQIAGLKRPEIQEKLEERRRKAAEEARSSNGELSASEQGTGQPPRTTHAPDPNRGRMRKRQEGQG
jgi:5-(carboxyamino)imidazole ribonucleotide mutase